MKHFFSLAAVAFLAGFAGVHLGVVTAADHQPILTGGTATIPNAVVFRENAVPANISALLGELSIKAGGTNKNIVLSPSGTGNTLLNSGSLTATGALTVAAGGANHNISLIPSGTGVVSLPSQASIDLGATPTVSQVALKANGVGALSLLAFAPDNVKVLFDADWIANTLTAENASVAVILKNGAKLNVFGGTGQTVGSPAVLNNLFQIDLATGNVNTIGVYQRNGTPGVSLSPLNVRNFTNTGTCAITVSGGLITGTSGC